MISFEKEEANGYVNFDYWLPPKLATKNSMSQVHFNSPFIIHDVMRKEKKLSLCSPH